MDRQDHSSCFRYKVLIKLTIIIMMIYSQEMTHMIPDNRLSKLIQHYKQSTKDTCKWHNTLKDISILHPHQCTRNTFPLLPKKIITQHTDEVWFVTVSNCGKYTATASKDKTAQIHVANNVIQLVGHSLPVTYCKFNGKSSMLITCSNDKTLKLWSVPNGHLVETFDWHKDVVTCCAWIDDNFFLSGCSHQLVMAHVDGNHDFKTLK